MTDLQNIGLTILVVSDLFFLVFFDVKPRTQLEKVLMISVVFVGLALTLVG